MGSDQVIYHYSVKQFWCRSGLAFCLAWSGTMHPVSKGHSTRQNLKVNRYIGKQCRYDQMPRTERMVYIIKEQTVWIQIRSNILSGLIWIWPDFEDYQQTMHLVSFFGHMQTGQTKIRLKKCGAWSGSLSLVSNNFDAEQLGSVFCWAWSGSDLFAKITITSRQQTTLKPSTLSMKYTQTV